MSLSEIVKQDNDNIYKKTIADAYNVMISHRPYGSVKTKMRH